MSSKLNLVLIFRNMIFENSKDILFQIKPPCHNSAQQGGKKLVKKYLSDDHIISAPC